MRPARRPNRQRAISIVVTLVAQMNANPADFYGHESVRTSVTVSS